VFDAGVGCVSIGMGASWWALTKQEGLYDELLKKGSTKQQET
jgi:uncharacterized membrane protein YwzB